MPEVNKATLKQILSAEVDAALSQRPDLEVVKLADGARDNWSYLEELAPQAVSSVRLVYFFHAAEHLRAAVDAAYGENDLRGRSPVREASACVCATITAAWRRSSGRCAICAAGNHGASGSDKCSATFGATASG